MLITSDRQTGQGGGKRNPIYLFYEQVNINQNGEHGEEGDKHYKCYHGSRKTFTITKKMNSSLNGEFQPLFGFYCLLSCCKRFNWTFENIISNHVSIIPCPESP